jgi:hypothetical protein
VQALVQDRQASCPSTRTGSNGSLPHIGQSSKIDGVQCSNAGWLTWLTVVERLALRTLLLQVSNKDFTFRAGLLDSVEA